VWHRLGAGAHRRALPAHIVIFGEPGSEPLLGAFTLEGFRLAADPVNRRLVPVPGLLKAGGAQQSSAAQHAGHGAGPLQPHYRLCRGLALGAEEGG